MVVTDDRVHDYARQSFPAGRDAIECVADLTARIHRDFEFRRGVTTVESTVDDLFATGAGVCQDFAHLAVGCLRATGLPARYVSGYLETETRDGSPKLAGVDVSHAWAAVLIPERGWVELDPTNDQFVDGRYITIGWGRDYGDVTPLKGVIHTDGGTADLTVTVDVVRLEGDGA
jgi:transglutaminase-like putative cysteine protease